MKLVTDQVQDALAHESTRCAINNYSGAVNREARQHYLKEIWLTLACRGNGNVGKKCGDAKIANSRLLDDLQRHVFADGGMCAKDVEDLSKDRSAGANSPNYDEAIAPAVDRVLKRKSVEDCPQSTG